MNSSKAKPLIILHLLIMGYSLSGVFTKFAGRFEFMSVGFILCYSAAIGILGVYAIGWQQIIKRIPLTTAFANKAVTLIWGIIYGTLFFSEQINFGKIVGSVVVMIGVILYVNADKDIDETGESHWEVKEETRNEK